ncbi:MAG TPA: DUF4129 domain-containing protein [Pseudonocardia sp.]
MSGRGRSSIGDEVRFGALAVLVVAVVVVGRARAAGLSPPPMSTRAAASVFDAGVEIGAVVVLAVGTFLLVSGRRTRRPPVAAATPTKQLKRGERTLNWRRVVVFVLAAALLALVFEVLIHPGDGLKVLPPSLSPFRPESPEGNLRSSAPGSGAGDPVKIVLIVLLMTGLALIVVLLRRNTVIEESDELDQGQAMVRAVQAGRQAVRDRTITDPREAIVACFAAMEHALAGRGGTVAPQLSDTASEVLARGVERASLPASAADTLLRLFREAQFSTHPMTDGDRVDADGSLAQLLGALEPTAGGRVRGGGSQ